MADYKRIYPDITLKVGFDNLQLVRNFYQMFFDKGLVKEPMENLDPQLLNFAVNAFALGVSTGLKLAEIEATVNLREGTSEIEVSKKE